MVYNIKKSDGTPLVSIPDSTQDTTATSLILPGRNSVSFGLAIDQNFVSLLQNFANSSAPPNAQIGQLWYDSIKLDLKIYNGNKWVSVTTGFDTASGVATTQIGPSKTEVTLILSQYQIVSVISSVRIQLSDCPDSIIYSDTSYTFAPRFPNGIYPGINIATDPTGMSIYRLNGMASTANILAKGRTINIGGVVSGHFYFDGSKDVNVTIQDSNIYVNNTTTTVAGTWSKVLVNDGGRIIEGNTLVAGDIAAALGYTPYDGSLININSVANTVVARDQNANFAANVIVVSSLISTSGVVGNVYGVLNGDVYGTVQGTVTGNVTAQSISTDTLSATAINGQLYGTVYGTVVGTTSNATTLTTPRTIYVSGDMYGQVDFDGSKNVVINSNLITTGVTAGTYNTVRVDDKGRVVNADWIDHSPYRQISLFPLGSQPMGWAICNGNPGVYGGVSTPTPNLTAAGVAISTNAGMDLRYYMKCGNASVLSNSVSLSQGYYGTGPAPLLY